jgi:hypothetical protein
MSERTVDPRGGDVVKGPVTNPTRAGRDQRGDETASLPQRSLEIVLRDNLLVLVILLQAVFILVVGRALLNVDSWLTLVSGREIWQHGLPHRDTLTAIPLGREWIDQQWLAQVAFYGLDRVGGLGLAIFFHALMVTAALTITVVAARLRGASSRMTLLAAVVCLVIAPWSWQLRAQSIALPLFALTLALMSTDPGLARRRTWLVFPALVLWANVHGSVVLGAVLVSLAGAFGLLGLIRRRQTVPVWRSAAFLGAPWLCLLATPYGADVVGYYRLILVDSPVSKNITEWRAPTPSGYFLLFFAAGAATVVIAIWQRRRLSPYDLAVLAVTLAGACRSVRAIVWFSLALAMLLPVALDGLLPATGVRHVHRRLAAALTGILAAAFVAVSIFTLTKADAWFEQDWSTRGARAAARAVRASDAGAVVWASGTYADWLLWKEPSLRGHLAWDARYELLTAPEMRAIVRFNGHKAGWQPSLLRYPLLVVDRRRHRTQARALLADPDFRVVFADDSVVIFSRT